MANISITPRFVTGGHSQKLRALLQQYQVSTSARLQTTTSNNSSSKVTKKKEETTNMAPTWTPPTNTEASINRSPSLFDTFVRAVPYGYGQGGTYGNTSPATFSFGGSSTPSTPSARCNGRGECSLGCVCNDLGSIDGPLDDL